MRKVLFFAVALLVLSSSFAASTVLVKPSPKASEIMIPIGTSGQQISMLDLSRISIKEVEQFTGRKMSFADRLAFKAAQKQLKKNINPDGSVNNKKLTKQMKKADGTSGFHLGGFALGFLLGLIGVLIAYLINDEKKSNRVKWAWIGLVAWVVIWIALVI